MWRGVCVFLSRCRANKSRKALTGPRHAFLNPVDRQLPKLRCWTIELRISFTLIDSRLLSNFKWLSALKCFANQFFCPITQFHFKSKVLSSLSHFDPGLSQY